MAEPVFDHHSYPELIDAILSYAPREALLVFRGTDRHYRGRIDDMLFEHVIVCPSEGTEATAKGKGKDTTETKPGLPGFDLLSSRPPYRRLPLLPYDPTDELDRWVLDGGRGEPPVGSPVSVQREDCREDIARRIRVVDLYGRPRVPFPFNQSFKDLDILRRPAIWTNHDLIAYAPTVVDYINLAKLAPGTTETKLHIDPGNDVSRHVIHIALSPKCAYTEVTFEEPTERRDLVLVFTMPAAEAAKTAVEANGTVAGLSAKDVFWRLTDLARSTLLAGGQVTYVGVESLDLGDDSDEEGTKFEKHLQDSLDSKGVTTGVEVLEEAVTRATFLTLDDWRASLPEENIEFEADWPSFEYSV